MEYPFKGLKVVELASILAGPLVGSFFGEKGAQVFKVENPKTDGDPTRGWKNESEGTPDGISAYYISANAPKIVQELDVFEDTEKLHQLLFDADILIHNFTDSKCAELQLSSNSLKEKYPRLISGQIKGFSNSEKPAFDFLMQARTGLLAMTGLDENNLAKLPLAWIDVLSAHQLYEALLIGLLERGNTQTGSHWSVSLEETALASLINQGSNAIIGKTDPKPLGTLHPNIAPYGECFFTQDGAQLAFAIGTDKQFSRLWKVLFGDLPNVSYSTNSKRLQNRANLKDALELKIESESLQHWETVFTENQLPITRILGVKEALNSEEGKSLTSMLNYTEGDFPRVQSSVFKRI